MKGAKRLLSVFLLLVMLCTFFVFPAGAVGEGTIPNFANSAWSKSESMVIGGNGAYIFCSGKYQTGGTAFLTLDLQPGERYKMSGRLGLSGTATSPQYVMTLTLANGEEVAVFDTTSKGSKNIDIEFVVPGNSGKVDLGIFLKPNSTIDYTTTWKIENTSTDKGILNSIKEGFSKLWEWLKSILDNIKEIPTKIGQFITTLGDRISTFFSSLTNSIKGFFTDLWDKIWNGDGSVPPFDNNNKFAQVIEKLNEWTAKIKEFSGSVDSSADTVTGYLQSGTSFLNSAMGAFPAALTAVLGFALVFIVVRKVVGR